MVVAKTNKNNLQRFFRGTKPKSLSGNASRKMRAAYKNKVGEFVSRGAKHIAPKWMKQADACLHDASRNNQMLSWSIIGYLEKKGIEYSKPLSENSSFYLKQLDSSKAKRLINLVGDYYSIEGRLVRLTHQSAITSVDELAASRYACRLLDLSHKMRTASSFLGEELKGTAGLDHYKAYLANFGIVKASLKPLVERKPRVFAVRFPVTMDDFFKDYSKRLFFDREGNKVKPIFKVSSIWTVKVNAEGLRSALGNLIQDAINHTPGTPIHVESGVSNGHVSIKVFNRGKPIPEERLPFIGHDAYWSKGQGRLRGRGKVSVRLFCEDHGGAFRVYNLNVRGKPFGPCLEMLLPRA